MRQIKTLMVAALTLVMGIMMTSCLNSEGGESMYDGAFLAKVVSAGGLYGGAIFEDAGGNRYEASYKSVTQLETGGYSFTGVEMAYIYFKFSVDETGNQITPPQQNATTPQTYQIELVAIQTAPTTDAERVETATQLKDNEYETSPIGISQMMGNDNNYVRFDFYDESMIYTYLQWFLTNGQEEFKKHNIRLAYAYDEITSSSTELRFYLCHSNGGDEGTSALYQNWYCFKVGNALADFERITGHQPSTVKISLYEDVSSMGVMPSSRTDYTINYKKN